MLSIYRRHIKTCAHRSEGRKYRRCRCPIWADGLIGGQEIRESLRTRNWEEAEEEKLPKLKTKFSPSTEAKAPDPITIAQAWEEFLADARARNLREPTLYKYDLLQAGVPMDRVSMLLGHSSIRVTEKHYSPWVRARQEQLEADVRRTWEPVFPGTKGTPEVHEKAERVN